jgi:hypothetical protein
MLMRIPTRFLSYLALACSAWGQSYSVFTYAGGGIPNGVPGLTAVLNLNEPGASATDAGGNLYFTYQTCVLRWDAGTGLLTVFAGHGTPGYSGDNAPANLAEFNGPAGLAFDQLGNL